MHGVEAAVLRDRGCDQRGTDASSAMSNVTEIGATAGVAHLGGDRVGVPTIQVTDDDRGTFGAEPGAVAAQQWN